MRFFAWLDGDPALRPHLETAQRISLSPIVLGEFRFGILGSRHRASYEQRLRLIEREFPPLPIKWRYRWALRSTSTRTRHKGPPNSVARSLDRGAGPSASAGYPLPRRTFLRGA